MVFAKDAGTAGDLSQFEGKTVALTGRIGLSPGGKPQIVIKSANQVKLADGVAPTTAATPAVPPTPAIPTPKPTPPLAVSESKRVAPAANWANAPQTGDMTRKDLMLLFGYLLTSNEKFVAEDSIVIYPEVPHLTPLATARKSLHLENTNPGRAKITTPSLPVASLTANTFPGVFPGGYTILTLVTDISDQVVGVHLTDSNPRQRKADLTDTGGYHAYDFIAQRGKSAGRNRHGGFAADRSEHASHLWKILKTSTAPRQPRTGKVLERSRCHVPKPLVNVILRASENR